MIASTMLQLKILRTKKRLSSTVWYLPLIVLGTMGLFLLLSFALRSISVAGKYGLVPAEIPILPVPIIDPTMSNFQAQTKGSIDRDTPVVILTEKEFIFGDLKAFSENISKALSNNASLDNSSGAFSDNLNVISVMGSTNS